MLPSCLKIESEICRLVVARRLGAEAIQTACKESFLDCFASLAMTPFDVAAFAGTTPKCKMAGVTLAIANHVISGSRLSSGNDPTCRGLRP